MKKVFIIALFSCLIFAQKSYAIYDFCESPADYNTLPQAYDVRTEYWKDIPDYQPDDIKYEDMSNKHPTFPAKFKKGKKNQKTTEDASDNK